MGIRNCVSNGCREGFHPRGGRSCPWFLEGAGRNIHGEDVEEAKERGKVGTESWYATKEWVFGWQVSWKVAKGVLSHEDEQDQS